MSTLQSRVLELVKKIPKGRVTTYAELARAIGEPRAWRAVANVLARNPEPIKIPCHRVVRSSGEVGGYKFGSRRKMGLLVREGVEVRKGKINFKKYLFKFG